MGNEGKIFGWHPPMKLPEFTEKQNLAGFWMNFCGRLDSILGRALWQAGPAPWMFWANNNQIWPISQNWGRFDGFDGSTKNNTGNVNKPNGNEPKKTPEEKQAEREQNANKRAEIRTLVNNYERMYSLLEEYGKTLTNKTEPTKDVFEETLADLKGKVNKNMTKEKLEEKIAEIKVMYEKYEDKIKEAKVDKITSTVTSTSNPQYKDLVGSLKEGIDDASETFGILKKNSSGAYKWGEISGDDEDQPIDIMELISAWNSTYVGEGEPAYLIKYIAEKRNTFTAAKKEQYKTLSDNLHKQLLDAGTEINQKRLSATTKKALKDALDDFKKFDSMDKRFPEGENTLGENYSNAFENLYIAIRLAEAEIADKDLEDTFNFLGDENPYKGKAATVETVKADLESECRETKTVTEPVVSKVPSGATEIKIENTSYHIHIQDGATKYYTADGTEMTADEFKNTVGEVEIKENGSYSIKNGETTTYYSAEHTEIDFETFNASGANNTEAPAAGSVENAIGKNYQNGYEKGHTLYFELKGPGSGRARNIIIDEINRDNVIGLIRGFEKDSPNENIIAYLSNDNIGWNICNRIIKAVMRQALHIGLNENNCKAYKTLAESFNATGTPAYETDGVTPSSSDSFKFNDDDGCNEYTLPGTTWTGIRPDQIYKMLIDLVTEIEKYNK